MSTKTTTSFIKYYDDELNLMLEEAVEQFTKCNIRFRSPNRNTGPTHQQKYFKPESED